MHERGRYRIMIALEESSVDPEDETGAAVRGGAPAFRSLRMNNTAVLEGGRRIEFLAATDRVSGQVNAHRRDAHRRSVTLPAGLRVRR